MTKRVQAYANCSDGVWAPEPVTMPARNPATG